MGPRSRITCSSMPVALGARVRGRQSRIPSLLRPLLRPPPPVEEPTPIPDDTEGGDDFPVPEPPVEPPTVQCQQLGKNDCRATSGCFRFRRTCWPTAENGAVCANISKKKLCRKTNCLW